MIGKEKIKKFIMEFGYVRLALLGICGVFLIVVSMPEKKKEIRSDEGNSNVVSSGKDDNDLYVEKMEKRLKNTLEKMKGVGKAEVMITLSASSEMVVNKDESQEESSEALPGENGKNSLNSVRKEETVLSEEDGEQKPYVLKEYEPVVEGVIVVIEGGDNSVVTAAVTEAVQALFPVEAHKIKVLKMEDGS